MDEHLSLFDLNQLKEEKSFYLNTIENAIDSLETALTFIDRKDNLKWKWISIAIHHSLYSFCIASLVNSNFEDVISNGSDDDKISYLKKGNDFKYKQSHKKKRLNSNGYTIEWTTSDFEPSIISNAKLSKYRGKKLIGFWTALARVQDQIFWMGRLSYTKALILNENEWQSIEWITEQVRNNCVHFVPKYWKVHIKDVKDSIKNILRVIEFLSIDSFSIISSEQERNHERIKQTLNSFRSKLTDSYPPAGMDL